MDAHITLATLPLDWETEFTGPDPHLAPSPSDASVPEQIGKYVVLALLGKGAMGAVYKAFDPVLEREVALKIMLPRIADDLEHKRRFEREARAVARLSHPNVVTVFDLGYHTDGSPYIVMELLKGRDLLHTLRDKPPFSLERKLGITLQVLEGLAHAHRAGIVHRDIKPANIFISAGDTAKITDFGVAHLSASSEATSGAVVGTANYMSPEQVLGGRIDGRSDLFSVGCMLVEMLTGRPPFEGETAMSTLYRVAHQEPLLPLPAGEPYERILPVLRRSLAKSPAERFATCDELAAALRACLDPAADEAARVDLGSPASAVRSLPVPAARPPAPPAPARPPDPTGICALLCEIHLGGKSGHLHFSHGDERRSLRLLQGRIVHATSDVPGEHLGDVLVRYGHLSQPDLERAVAVVLGERRRLGTVLREMGLIEPAALGAAVGEHAREILFSALERPDASYGFEELPDTAPEADLTCELSTAEAILEATRRVHDPALIERALGDMTRVLVRASDPRVLGQKVALTPTDGFVLSRVDGTLSAREMLSLVPGPPDEAARSLFGLLSTGLVSFEASPARRRAPTAARARPEPSPQAATRSAPKVTVERTAAAPGRSPAPPTLSGESLRQMILSAYESLRYKDHFEFLDVPRAAPEGEIKEAYARLVRVLHPDVCRDPAVADLATERAAVFARLSQAYETLRSPAARATYERDVAPVKRRPSLPRADATPSPPRAEPSSPEPLPLALPPLAEEAPAESTPGVESDLAVAARLMKQEKYWDAIQILEPVVRRALGPARNRARLLLAQAYLKNPHWSRRAEAVLQTVVGEDPRIFEAYFLLAGLYLKSNLEARAAAMFRKALELRPDHAGAAAGLKALESPRALPLRLPFLRRA